MSKYVRTKIDATKSFRCSFIVNLFFLSNKRYAHFYRPEWLRAFAVHVVVALEGPAPFRKIIENEDVKSFFENQASIWWYKEQEVLRSQFRASQTFQDLQGAISDCGWDLVPSPPAATLYDSLFYDTISFTFIDI